MKKVWLYLFGFSLFLQVNTIKGQDEPVKKRWLYIETGTEFMACAAPDNKSYIRAENTPYSYGYETSYVTALLYSYQASAKFEVRAWQEKLGIIGGIKYTRLENSIGKEEYWNTGSDYFFVMINQGGTNTEYLKVKDITETSSYVGIPLDIRFYPYENRKIQLYYKIGFDFNFLAADKTKVSFKNSLMDAYEDEVIHVVEEPWSFYSSVHLGIGLKIGSYNKPGLNIEARVPSFMLYDAHNSFINPQAGGGLAISFRIPL